VRDVVAAEVMRRKAFTTRQGGLSFAWEGGQYIDVIYAGQAFEAINVVGQDGELELARTQRAFNAYVKAWLRDVWAGDMAREYQANVFAYM
jgi:hypothetical protein